MVTEVRGEGEVEGEAGGDGDDDGGGAVGDGDKGQVSRAREPTEAVGPRRAGEGLVGWSTVKTAGAATEGRDRAVPHWGSSSSRPETRGQDRKASRAVGCH